MIYHFRIYINGRLSKKGKKKTLDKCLSYRPKDVRGLLQGDTMRVQPKGRKPIWFWYHADIDKFLVHVDCNQKQNTK